MWLTVLVISRDVAIVATVAIVSLTLGPGRSRRRSTGRSPRPSTSSRSPWCCSSTSCSRPSIVVDDLDLGQPGDHADLGLPLHRARAPHAQRAASFVLKYSIVVPSPSSRETFGLPAEQRRRPRDVGLAHLRVVDGQRRGSTIRLDEPGEAQDRPGDLLDGQFLRVADVDRARWRSTASAG
ncbi:MAG: hypothetical protein MZV64_72960 [Ignavibacteriales bacterium]|nr:hypothetical protein [Ignavibacteriales bacterium]